MTPQIKGTHVMMHKKTGDMAIVTPIFVALRCEDMDDYAPKPAPSFIDVVMYQEIGVMFENEHECCFVFPHKVLEEFEDLGIL